ncbi:MULTISPECIES: STAS domain-containing protein [unclassified Streptomyces]|uniref:STAS domain-containing protein n=1 Tax=unclassified Streptomyces TaxID=2593676 RepID=UPI002E1677CA|nr:MULTISPECIES: STAS domain-containing protein [unclassified Streptomyces]WSR23404.1 STAS domain-containing protein [Streptomyces sp. NBC_01205]
MRGDGESGSEGVEVEVRGSTAVVRLYGEMDIDRAENFREVLLAVLSDAQRPRTVVIDLDRLSFCDSSGLNVLLNARTVAAESGQNLYLAASGEQFVRPLEITDAGDLFTIELVAPF